MKKIITLVLLLFFVCNACKQPNQTESANDSTLVQHNSNSESIDTIELEEFNESDFGSPGVTNTWRTERTNLESNFFEALKNPSQNSDIFVFDSIPFITASQGIYAQVKWLKEPSDLLGIDEFVLLVNPNSSFNNNNLRLNDWNFEDECQLEEFPDGIYTKGMTDENSYLSYSVAVDEQKELNLLKTKLNEFNFDLIQTYYFTWRTVSDEKVSIKIHTVKVNQTLKVFAVSNFICGG